MSLRPDSILRVSISKSKCNTYVPDEISINVFESIQFFGFPATGRLRGITVGTPIEPAAGIVLYFSRKTSFTRSTYFSLQKQQKHKKMYHCKMLKSVLSKC